MENKLISVKTAIAIAIGAALMFVLNYFAGFSIGVEGTYIQLGIAVLAAIAAIFGPIAGFLTGLIGHFLVDLVNYLTQAEDQLWWSWIISSAIFGLVIGSCWKMYLSESGNFGVKQALIFNGIQIAANVLVWVFIARTLDMLIYKEPFGKVSLQGFAAAAVNSVVVLVLGTLLIFVYHKVFNKAK